MGAEIYIRLEDDIDDTGGNAPFLGRDFQHEISRGAIWENREPFLTELEQKVLEAPYCEEMEELFIDPIEPDSLQKILLKVKKYLYDNEQLLPFEVCIDYQRMEKENLSTDLVVNESRCWIRGDSFVYKVTDKVEIVNYPNEKNEIDMWVNIADEIEIEDQKYFLKRVTRYEKYSKEIDEVIDFCADAIENNKKVYWMYIH